MFYPANLLPISLKFADMVLLITFTVAVTFNKWPLEVFRRSNQLATDTTIIR